MSPKLPQHGAPTASGREPGRGPSAETTRKGLAEGDPEQNAGPESKAKPSKIKVVYETPRGRGFTISGVKS